MEFAAVYGVDFSGARLAGRATWVARVERDDAGGLALASLDRLEKLAGTAERGPALAHLVGLVAASSGSLWGMDFPFGLPLEVLPEGTRWPEQLLFLSGWADGAYAAGLEFLRRAKLLGGPNHIRRLTDTEAKAPFDCYHYRIIYQTFHGMRDVLLPLASVRGTAVLPFHYRRLPTCKRVVVESCPSSTLKRLGLPHHTYKQPAGGPLTRKRIRNRHLILAGLLVAVGDRHRRAVMRDGGGDALDAVIAAVGAAQAFAAADHRRIARHPRYPREGYLYS